jgi:hypothetical protein
LDRPQAALEIAIGLSARQFRAVRGDEERRAPDEGALIRPRFDGEIGPLPGALEGDIQEVGFGVHTGGREE